MKKVLKIVVIFLILCIGIILIDTLQARIRKRSPLIRWKEKIKNTESYIDRGIIMDTYYCVDYDTVYVKWNFKIKSYECPAPEKSKTQENEKKYIGEWIADGTQIKSIISVDSNNNPIYANDYDEPYNLIIKQGNIYSLKLNDNKTPDEEGTYQVKYNEITFMPSNGNFTWNCKLIDEKLECNFYANHFVKVK